jgi:hypothetical protein
MFIARKSLSSGIVRTLDIPIEAEALQAYHDGGTVEKTLGKLNLHQREFIMTGMTRGEWIEAFGAEDNDYGKCPKLTH